MSDKCVATLKVNFQAWYDSMLDDSNYCRPFKIIDWNNQIECQIKSLEENQSKQPITIKKQMDAADWLTWQQIIIRKKIHGCSSKQITPFQNH